MSGKPGEIPNDYVTIDVPVENQNISQVAPAENDPLRHSTNPDTGKVFTAEEVESIRKQEKDKLYKELNKQDEKVKTLQDQIDIFNKEREEQQRLAAELRQHEEAERKAREMEEMSAKELLLKTEDEFNQKLNSAQQEWEQKFAILESEKAAQAALLEQERRFQELESYKARRIQEEQESIMPELVEFITGNSEQDIEASISAVAARTSAILSYIQQAIPQNRVRGVPPTGYPPTGPVENMTEQQTYTAADIASMSNEEYAKVRDRLLASARPNRGR
jgi:DNA repair exonuclease SbcCD ATPase subunit